MLTPSTIPGTRVVYILASPPFSAARMLDFVREVAEGAHPGVALDSPCVLDMRAICLADLTAADVSRYGMRRAALADRPTAGPMAIVCSDMATFGMLRMFGIIADLSGLRPEQEYCVTTDLEEAARFVAGRAAADPDDLVAQVAELAEDAAVPGRRPAS